MTEKAEPNGLEKKITKEEFEKYLEDKIDEAEGYLQQSIELHDEFEKFKEAYEQDKKKYNIVYFKRKEQIMYITYERPKR